MRSLMIGAELAPLLIATAANIVVLSLFGHAPSIISQLNAYTPIVTGIGCIWSAVLMLRKASILIWSPMVWFSLGSALYFCIGALAYPFGSEETTDLMSRYFPVDQQSLEQTNLLNNVGIFVVGIIFALCSHFKRLYINPNTLIDYAHLKRLAFVTLSVGVPVKYLLVLPSAFGLVNFILPGIYYSLGNFTLVGIVTLIILSHKEKKWTWAAVALTLAELGAAVLTLSKQNCVFVLLAVTLGLFIVYRTLRVFAISALGCLLVYVFMSTIVPDARNLLLGGNQDYSGRIQSIKNAYEERAEGNGSEGNGFDDAWARLCFSSAQAFAMQEYQEGREGATFEYIYYTFIPRFIWPDKPVMSLGSQFHELVTGSSSTQSTPTFFAEAYWNAGWPAVIICCSYVGCLFFILTDVSCRCFTRHDYRWLPSALLGIMLASAPADSWFVASFVGPVPIMVAFMVFICILVPPPRVVGVGS